ncbi:hypothetical protein AHAS_Ahas06G0051400 [Arachis hypogaea]
MQHLLEVSLTLVANIVPLRAYSFHPTLNFIRVNGILSLHALDSYELSEASKPLVFLASLFISFSENEKYRLEQKLQQYAKIQCQKP